MPGLEGSSTLVEGCGHVVEGAGGGQRAALSTGRAGARQRIVHMSTACRARSARPPPRGRVVLRAPLLSASAGACRHPLEQRGACRIEFLGGLDVGQRHGQRAQVLERDALAQARVHLGQAGQLVASEVQLSQS